MLQCRSISKSLINSNNGGERNNLKKWASLQTFAIPDVPEYVIESLSSSSYFRNDLYNCQTPMFLLTLKLYDALKTHSQFNLSNALPGYSVDDFLKDSVSYCAGQCKVELEKIVKFLKMLFFL